MSRTIPFSHRRQVISKLDKTALTRLTELEFDNKDTLTKASHYDIIPDGLKQPTLSPDDFITEILLHKKHVIDVSPFTQPFDADHRRSVSDSMKHYFNGNYRTGMAVNEYHRLREEVCELFTDGWIIGLLDEDTRTCSIVRLEEHNLVSRESLALGICKCLFSLKRRVIASMTQLKASKVNMSHLGTVMYQNGAFLNGKEVPLDRRYKYDELGIVLSNYYAGRVVQFEMINYSVGQERLLVHVD